MVRVYSVLSLGRKRANIVHNNTNSWPKKQFALRKPLNNLFAPHLVMSCLQLSQSSKGRDTSAPLSQPFEALNAISRLSSA